MPKITLQHPKDMAKSNSIVKWTYVAYPIDADELSALMRAVNGQPAAMLIHVKMMRTSLADSINYLDSIKDARIYKPIKMKAEEIGKVFDDAMVEGQGNSRDNGRIREFVSQLNHYLDRLKNRNKHPDEVDLAELVDKCLPNVLILDQKSGYPVLARYGKLMFFNIYTPMRETYHYWGDIGKMLDYVVPKILKMQIKTHDNKTKYQDNILIGMDPELICYRKDDAGEVDYESQVNAGGQLQASDCSGLVGTDGHSTIFELRPAPAKDAEGITLNVESALRCLAFKMLESNSQDNYCMMAGGGLGEPIGGHIHISGEFTTKIRGNQIASFFGKLADDFIYFPMRDKMPGAMRAWGRHSNISRGDQMAHIPKLKDKRPAVVFEEMSKIERFPRGLKLDGYDTPNSFRFNDWGFEYRSLPSFIVDKELTYIVCYMALAIAKKTLKCINERKDFSYNQPPREQDYLKLVPVEIFRRFMRYINGDRRTIFMTDVFKNWGISQSIYVPSVHVNVAGSDGMREMKPWRDKCLLLGEECTRELHTFLESMRLLNPRRFFQKSRMMIYLKSWPDDQYAICTKSKISGTTWARKEVNRTTMTEPGNAVVFMPKATSLLVPMVKQSLLTLVAEIPCKEKRAEFLESSRKLIAQWKPESEAIKPISVKELFKRGEKRTRLVRPDSMVEHVVDDNFIEDIIDEYQPEQDYETLASFENGVEAEEHSELHAQGEPTQFVYPELEEYDTVDEFVSQVRYLIEMYVPSGFTIRPRCSCWRCDLLRDLNEYDTDILREG